jgi:hypothetical protein
VKQPVYQELCTELGKKQMIYLKNMEMISTTGKNTIFYLNILVFGRHAVQISVGRLVSLRTFLGGFLS